MKKLACVIGAACAFFSLAAIEVNESELRAANDESGAVEFENYAGPHSVIESADAIRSIGTSLGSRVASSPEAYAVYDPEGKYTLVHAVNTDETGKFDADILVLNATAGVDHIRNLRRIIEGFVSAAYGYSAADAETLAVFITVYNAVYRGETASFIEKYKDTVIDALDGAKAGLSVRWQEWAGATQIVIPLGTSADGTPVSVDTSTISDDRVVEALRKEDDHAVDKREQLNDIKAREAGDAAENAKDAQKQAAQQRNEGDRKGAAKSARTATEQQQIADRKRTEVQEEKKAIADDRAALDAAPALNEKAWITGLFSADNKGSLYTLVTVDGATGRTVRKSDLKHIRSAVVYALDGMYLAVCGENKGKAAVRLCLIDAATLEIAQESAAVLSETSPLVQTAGGWYAVVQEGSACYAALFDASLALLHKSAVPVSPATPFNQTAQGLLVSEPNGTPHLLAPGDLSTIW